MKVQTWQQNEKALYNSPTATARFSVFFFFLLVPPSHKLLAPLDSGTQIQKLCFNICCDSGTFKQKTFGCHNTHTDMENNVVSCKRRLLVRSRPPRPR